MDIHQVARSVAEGLLNSLPAGIAIALIAWVIAHALRGFGASVRFTLWLVALAAIPFLLGDGAPASASSRVLPSPAGEAVTLPASLAIYLLVFWTLGASFGLLRLVMSLYRLRRLRTTCSPVDHRELDPALRSELNQVQKNRKVTLCASSAVRVPAALGYVRPVVVFPAWALAELPVEQFRAVLVHELAHLRRYDDWTNLAQKLLKALLFFHPAVWFIEPRLTLEREMACDDAVLAASFAPRAYAESLVSLAEKSFLRRGVQLAQAAVSHVHQLKLRLAEILRKDKGVQGSARLRKPAVALMSLAAIVSVYGISRAPRLVAFSSDAPQLASASTVSHALSRTNDFHLQPVNLSYTDRRQPASAPAGRVQRTQLRVTHRAATKPQLVLVVFQGEQFGPNGPVFWRVGILHLTPAQQRVITGGISKKI